MEEEAKFGPMRKKRRSKTDTRLFLDIPEVEPGKYHKSTKETAMT